MTSIDRVLTALNAHDLEAFVNCYDPVATIEDGNDKVLAHGHLEIGNRYRLMFENFPSLYVQALGRWEAGPYILQQELVTGRTAEPEHHIAVYQLTNELIVRERLLR